MLRYLTAGESHGGALVSILEGMPAGLKVDEASLNRELSRRQKGFGRGKRMSIERDRARVIAGLKRGLTIGSPLAFLIQNRDASIERLPAVLCPRPGHADLAGILKYGFRDARCVLERASARETASRVAIGAVCKQFLARFGVRIKSTVLSIGGECSPHGMKEKITDAIRLKDTVGGIFEVTASGVPVGLGSYVHPDRRLDARLAAEVMSIPGIKAVEIGLGFAYENFPGSACHDAIYYSRGRGFFRKTNNAGGVEGGISNGEDVVVRACIKPIATLMKPLASVNILSKRPASASVERSDTCVVEAGGVITESACAFVLADAFLEKFGGDNLEDILEHFRRYLKRTR